MKERSPPSQDMAPPRSLLPIITLAQLMCASLWFAANGVLAGLQKTFGLDDAALGWLTSSVQLGFIAGTLCFAVLLIADRFSMRLVFLVCALAGAVFNGLVVVLPVDNLIGLIALRFATGFSLAGIYPVGMKLAASWYRVGLGSALGYLVGALVVGTALPHLLRATGASWPWQEVMLATSVLSILGGCLVSLLVRDGPYLGHAAPVSPRALMVIVGDRQVRASAFGYFGHMWELYAFIVLTPVVIATYLNNDVTPAVSALSFVVIAMGGLGCVAGGYVARRFGSARVAAACLAVSGMCAVLAPWMGQAPWWLFAAWMLIWGTTVSADSPQFSTLTAQNAPREVVGSVLTFVNCIGFSITIVSIQWLTSLTLAHGPWSVLPILAVGPVLGLLMMAPLLRRHRIG